MASNSAHFDFAGARVLVTGGSNGIGLGIARAFRAANAKVAITGRKAKSSDYKEDLSGLDYHQAKRFSFRIDYQQVEALHDRGDIVARAQQSHIVSNAQLSDRALEKFEILMIAIEQGRAYDEQHRIRNLS